MTKIIRIIPKCRERGCGKVLSSEEKPFHLCLDHFPAHSTPSCEAGFCSHQGGDEEESLW